jgi:catechol 2,3-dioxygenase-like lactoylglutathione lyase family enzyme
MPESTVSDLRNFSLGHIGIFVHDLPGMAAFYQRVFGFIVTDAELDSDGTRRSVFLSRNPAEHHQFVLISGPGIDPSARQKIQQISFRTDSLAEVRRTYFRLRAERLGSIEPITHGTSWSVYFRDPENNRIELFADTPWYITQPFVAPVDYNKSDDLIRHETEQLCHAQPGFRMMSDWREEIADRMRHGLAALARHEHP